MDKFLISLHYDLQIFSLVRNYVKNHLAIEEDFVYLVTTYILTEQTPIVEDDIDVELQTCIYNTDISLSSHEYSTIFEICERINRIRSQQLEIASQCPSSTVKLENFVNIDNDSLLEHIVYLYFSGNTHNQRVSLINALMNLIISYNPEDGLESLSNTLSEELLGDILLISSTIENFERVIPILQEYYNEVPQEYHDNEDVLSEVFVYLENEEDGVDQEGFTLTPNSSQDFNNTYYQDEQDDDLSSSRMEIVQLIGDKFTYHYLNYGENKIIKNQNFFGPEEDGMI